MFCIFFTAIFLAINNASDDENRGAENDKYLNRLKTEYYTTYDILIKFINASLNIFFNAKIIESLGLESISFSYHFFDPIY